MKIVCNNCGHSNIKEDYNEEITYICSECCSYSYYLSIPRLPLSANYGNRNRL